MATMAEGIKTRQCSFPWLMLFVRTRGVNIDSDAAVMALKHGIEDIQLPQAIRELRIFDCIVISADRGIEAAKKLLEGVVVAFTVSAGKIGVAAGLSFE